MTEVLTDAHRKDMADYLLDNYGECELGSERCYHGPGPQCLKRGWRGRDCPHWKTLGARTLEELGIKTARIPGPSATEN